MFFFSMHACSGYFLVKNRVKLHRKALPLKKIDPVVAVEFCLQTHRESCGKKISSYSCQGLFINLSQCSSWLFLSFSGRPGSLMIPACPSSVYLTPGSALGGRCPPSMLTWTQSCTDHFILWDKPVFHTLCNPETKNSKVRTFPQVIRVCH